MQTLDDVRAIALSFPGVFEKISGHSGGAGWRTTAGQLVWERGPRQTDLAQLEALGRAWPDGTVVAVHTDGMPTKEALIGTFPEIFFDIPHFAGYAAVLVRLDAIDRRQLTEIITDAWLLRAPKRVAAEWLAAHPG